MSEAQALAGDRPPLISVIVPTIGRPESLTRLLDSLAAQTLRVDEVVVADGSADRRTAAVIADARWADAGLKVRRVAVQPPHAVRQREAAIAASDGDLLLLLDDDVELELQFVELMLEALNTAHEAVAVVGVDDRQSGDGTTRLTRMALLCLFQCKNQNWQGRVIGPLLRFNYWPLPDGPAELHWLGGGCTLLSRMAFQSSGGFSSFFLDRSTMNEDVDLAIKIRRVGKIYVCPAARFAHHHDPGGRGSKFRVARDDIFNRFMIMRHTMQKRPVAIFMNLVLLIILDLTAGLSSVRNGADALPPAAQRFAGQISGFYLALTRRLDTRSAALARADDQE